MEPKTYFVLFSERHPTGIVIAEEDLEDYAEESGYLYKIGQRIGSVQSLLDAKPVKKGDTVNVPEGGRPDLHAHAFQGTVKKVRGKYAVVEDQDGDCFDIEMNRLDVVE